LPPPLAGSRSKREKQSIMPNYQVYILRSLEHNRYYIGHSENVEKRVSEHNFGKVRSTKAYRPWKIIYTEKKENKKEAYAREMQIKSFKHGEAFKKLIENCS
jgi:putative endonuclease